MEKKAKDFGKEIIIDVNASKIEGYVDDLPSVDESELKPSPISANEPAPFDPLSTVNDDVSSEIVAGAIEVNDELDAAAETATAKEEMPTPESVAAELKEVAEHAHLDEDEDELEGRPEMITTPSKKDASKKKNYLPVIIAIAALAILSVAAVFLLPLFAPKKAESSTERTATDNRAKETTYDYVIGSWESQAEGGSCYVFTADKEFYWLRNSEDFDDNYYYGKVISIDRGTAALRKSGTTFENAKQMLQIKDETIIEDDIYYLNLQATERKIGGVDTSSTLGTDPIKLLFIHSENGDKAYGYQYNSGDAYIFVNNPEIVAPTRQK